MILQCIRFLTQHFHLHEKDHKYCQMVQQLQTNKQSTTADALGQDSVMTGDVVDMNTAGDKLSQDPGVNMCDTAVLLSSVTSDGVTVKADVSDSDTVCGLSEDTVSSDAALSDRDTCDTAVTMSVSTLPANHSSQCTNGTDDIAANTCDIVTPVNNDTGNVSADSGDPVTQCNHDTADDISADICDIVTAFHYEDDNIAADADDTIVQPDNDIDIDAADICDTVTEHNYDTCNTAADTVTQHINDTDDNVVVDTCDTVTQRINDRCDIVTQFNYDKGDIAVDTGGTVIQSSDIATNACDMVTQYNIDTSAIAADMSYVVTECINDTDDMVMQCNNNTSADTCDMITHLGNDVSVVSVSKCQ